MYKGSLRWRQARQCWHKQLDLIEKKLQIIEKTIRFWQETRIRIKRCLVRNSYLDPLSPTRTMSNAPPCRKIHPISTTGALWLQVKSVIPRTQYNTEEVLNASKFRRNMHMLLKMQILFISQWGHKFLRLLDKHVTFHKYIAYMICLQTGMEILYQFFLI